MVSGMGRFCGHCKSKKISAGGVCARCGREDSRLAVAPASGRALWIALLCGMILIAAALFFVRGHAVSEAVLPYASGDRAEGRPPQTPWLQQADATKSGRAADARARPAAADSQPRLAREAQIEAVPAQAQGPASQIPPVNPPNAEHELREARPSARSASLPPTIPPPALPNSIPPRPSPRTLTPPPAPANPFDRLDKVGAYFTGSGRDLAAIGPQLAGRRIALPAAVTFMSNPWAGIAGRTDLVSKDGAMTLRIDWKDAPRELREYFQLVKQRKGNPLVLRGVVESYDEGVCVLRVEKFQER